MLSVETPVQVTAPVVCVWLAGTTAGEKENDVPASVLVDVVTALQEVSAEVTVNASADKVPLQAFVPWQDPQPFVESYHWPKQ